MKVVGILLSNIFDILLEIKVELSPSNRCFIENESVLCISQLLLYGLLFLD